MCFTKHRSETIRRLWILATLVGALAIVLVACGEDKLVSSSATGTLSVQMEFVDNPAKAAKGFGSPNIALIDSIRVMVTEEDSDQLITDVIVAVAEIQNSFLTLWPPSFFLPLHHVYFS